MILVEFLAIFSKIKRLFFPFNSIFFRKRIIYYSYAIWQNKMWRRQRVQSGISSVFKISTLFRMRRWMIKRTGKCFLLRIEWFALTPTLKRKSFFWNVSMSFLFRSSRKIDTFRLDAMLYLSWIADANVDSTTIIEGLQWYKAQN